MALIADNRAGNHPDKIIMIDDGTGVSVAIPTVIITKEFGEVLKTAVLETEENNRNPTNTKQFVVLLVDFEMDNPDDRVEYDIWYTSGDSTALNYISGMKAFNDKLGAGALMTPHIVVRTCSYCVDTDTDCRRYGDTMYCAGFSNTAGITGRDSLTLGVEELCIYDIYKDIDNAEKWWEYMMQIEICRPDRFSQQCITRLQEALSIDTSKIYACKHKEAEMLINEANNWLSSGIPYSPAVVINNKVFRVILCKQSQGTLEPESVFKAICAGFNVTPEICIDEAIKKAGSIGVMTIIMIIVLVILLNVVFIYLYRRHTKKEMREEMQLQISSVMSQYLALNENTGKTVNP